MSNAVKFFYEYAGFGFDPATETQAQGRLRCAKQLAEAEALYLKAHQCADIGIAWEDDPDGFADYRADKRAGRLTKGDAPKRIERAFIWHRHEDDGRGRDWLASLHGIWDADTNYRRVVRAELALECADELRKLI